MSTARETTPSVHSLVMERQLNHPNFASQFELFSRQICTRLYHCFHPCVRGWPPSSGLGSRDSPYGAVFNMAFSPEDNVVLAVCANRAILSYDPHTHCRVGVVPHAHEDSVNCVTFLDNLTFVTCSDDKTIRLWDLRNLHGSTAVLSGHTNWVKNIEYDSKSGLLFTVAFNDGVRAWDLDKPELYTQDEVDNLVFKTNNPVRMKLSPSRAKMIITTRDNLCLVVNEFDANSICEISANVEALIRATTVLRIRTSILQELSVRKANRPVLHFLSNRRNATSRAVMSAAFQSDEMIGLRQVDVKNDALCQELTTLYDLRTGSDVYDPFLRGEKCYRNYLKYVDEYSPTESINFIKEIAFSHDGRVLASPYQNGVRLLAVDAQCTPADVYFDDRYHSHDKSLQSLEFEELGVCQQHVAPVLTCQFAHTDCLLATGCLGGQVKFYSPQL